MSNKNLLKGFKKPSVSFEAGKQEANRGIFYAGPFEKGFGVTIANSLRRALLSSIQGYAISAIKIDFIKDGKQHILSSEFETIAGIKEDTIDIVANLKGVNILLTNEDEETRVITIEKKGSGVFKAGELEVDNGVKILNPDHYIATLEDKADFTIEMQIDFSRGYVSTDKIDPDTIETIGTIPIDAMFSPIEKVSYKIENARVGQRGDYDKVELDITTDATITPEDAIAQAAKILKEHFSCFINFQEEPEFEQSEYDEEKEKMVKILDTSVEELELSVRSSNCLKMANINSIGDLVQRSEEEMVKTKNFGKKSLAEIQNKLKQYSLALGMKEVYRKYKANTN
ncbi:MAG: DNA-directed RNA polymerase subunit alpha [Spirochaetes bacterium]|nr:DNA-directed RNA polymerase subunit alpha [Spirochaetota bacterium]